MPEEQSRRAASRARLRARPPPSARSARYARREAARKTELATASDVEAAARLEAAERALSRAERDRLTMALQVSQEVSTAVPWTGERGAVGGHGPAHQGKSPPNRRACASKICRGEPSRSFPRTWQLLAEFGPRRWCRCCRSTPISREGRGRRAERVRACRQERALAKAQKDLEKLGREPLALEEHERGAGLAAQVPQVDQVQDLKQSKADLLRTQDVDRLVEEAFASAFAETREQFGTCSACCSRAGSVTWCSPIRTTC